MVVTGGPRAILRKLLVGVSAISIVDVKNSFKMLSRVSSTYVVGESGLVEDSGVVVLELLIYLISPFIFIQSYVLKGVHLELTV